MFAQATVQRLADGAARHHITKRVGAHIGATQMRHAATAALRDVDVENRFGMRGDVVPHAEAGENLPRVVGQGQGAGVKTRLRRGGRGRGLNHRHGRAVGRQRQRQRAADQAAADDDDIGTVR